MVKGAPSYLRLFSFPFAAMDSAPTATMSCAARIRAWAGNALLVLGLHLVLMGVPEFISRWTTLPLYLIKIPLLTIVALITGKSFVIRRPRRLPRFIGSPFHRTLRTYTPSSADINYICSRGGVGTRLFSPRRWKPTEDVFIELEEYISNHPSPVQPSEEIDFSGFQLVGPRLVQGQGIIGRGICFVLIEELGRWPGHPGIIAGRLFSWEKREVVIGKIPASFVAVSGVEEVIAMENGFFRFVWPDLETGMVHGLQGEIIFPEALFAPGPDDVEEDEPLDYEEDLASILPSSDDSGIIASVF